jgi:hypothetical protein
MAVHCALSVCTDEEWRSWAEKWLSGEGRVQDAAAAGMSGAVAGREEAAASVYYREPNTA